MERQEGLNVMDRHIEVIGIDHGWSGMKTSRFCFTSGVKEITTEPAMKENILGYKGKFYKIGGKRLEVKENKVQDSNYYLLTLAALAKELKARKKYSARVLIAAGLPLARFGAEKEDFIRYLSREKEVSFIFEGEKFSAIIERVSVYPQCYGAVADKLYKYPDMVTAIDLGSWTLDVMPVVNRDPDESRCVTLPHGVITCIQQINRECVRQLNGEADEAQIQQFLINGGSSLPEKYQDIVVNEVSGYCRQIYHHIRELGYNLDVMPFIFCGGGALLMKQFGGLSQGNIHFVEDVRANAKGFELLGRAYINGMEGRKNSQAGGN